MRGAPTLSLAIDGEDRDIRFQCSAEMSECLKALETLQDRFTNGGGQE